MKRINITIFLMMFVLFTISSCSESLLDKDSIGDFSSDDYLNTPEEAQSAIIGLYDAVQSAYNGNAWNSPMLMYNILSDEVNAGGGSKGDQPQMQAFNSYSHGTDNPAVASIFHDYYTFISSANTILTTISDELSNSSQIKGEALFFRAYSYFHLVRAWGAVPFYLENPTVLTSGAPRTDAATIYKQIEQDLNDALPLLPLKSELGEGFKFRVSHGAAQSLLGKVYLYQEKYGEAQQAFASVISSEEYELEENFTEILDIANRAGDETVFEILYVSNNVVDWGGPWDGTAESNFIAQLSGPRSDIFADIGNVNETFTAEKEANTPGYEYKVSDLINGWGFCIPTKKIGDHIVKNAGTERADGSVLSAVDYEAAGGTINAPKPDDYPAYEGYMRVKWATRKSSTSADGVTELNHQIPFKMIRYADVLLMAAEAYNKGGKDAEAIAELKKVRARAGFTDFSDFESKTGDDLFEFIVNERINELAFEGHRFFDLVRWGKAASELGSLGFDAGKNELLPIPQSEINKNPDINVEDQNPGY